jgi:hypothetical protein
VQARSDGARVYSRFDNNPVGYSASAEYPIFARSIAIYRWQPDHRLIMGACINPVGGDDPWYEWLKVFRAIAGSARLR